MIYICSTIHLSEIPVPCGVRGREPFRSTDRASEARLVLLVLEPTVVSAVEPSTGSEEPNPSLARAPDPVSQCTLTCSAQLAAREML